ncbi:MAG: outer membrane beta-barrel protein [Candidatus Aminicenantes bacterium]|nr:outer membrane beta-barrel protein [Candidatus Aminicenantes bacterium]
MRIKFYGRAGLSLIVISLFILPTLVQAEKQKIRVVVENASIRMQPNMESEVIENPPVGSVFEVERKIGEWYEVRYQSKVGVRITGYIHEMLVELEKVAPAATRTVTPQRRREPVRPTPPPPMRRQPPKIMFNIGVGGLVHMIQAGYDWEYTFIIYSEQAAITDMADNATGFGFDAGFGVFPMPNIEITGGLSFVSKSLDATYGFSLPNMFLWDDIATDEIQEQAKYSALMLHFGFNFHPLIEGSVRPYFGGGISYISAKMDMMEDMIYQETFYSDWTHTIELTEVEWVQESFNKLGFNVRAGANFQVANNIYIYGEGRYIIAKTSIPHPLLEEIGVEGDEIDIDLGGFSAVLGVKIGL